MKLIVSLVAFLLLLTLLFGCNAMEEQPNSDIATNDTQAVSEEATRAYQLPFPVQSVDITTVDEKFPMEAGGFSVDNETSLEELLHHSYPLDELQAFFAPFPAYNYYEASWVYFPISWYIEHPGTEPDKSQFHAFYMSEINERFPMECLRLNNRHYYTVYRVEEGGYYYVFFASTFNETFDPISDPRMNTSFYLDRTISPKAFADVEIGKTTMDEIVEIDPSLDLDFGRSSGPASYSLLSDGSILALYYLKDAEEWMTFMEAPNLNYRRLYYVDDAVIYQQGPSCALGSILQADFP